MSNLKKILALTAVGALYATAALAGSGKASTVAINYYQTYASGSVVPMYGAVTVSGYVDPNNSHNTVWYELHDRDGIYQEVEAAIGANGILVQYKTVPTDDYHLDLNPDGPNYDSVTATGKAQN